MFLCVRFTAEPPTLHLSQRFHRSPGTRLFPCAGFPDLQHAHADQPVYFLLPSAQELIEGEIPEIFLCSVQAVAAVKRRLLPLSGFLKLAQPMEKQARFLQSSDPLFQEKLSVFFEQQQNITLLSDEQEPIGSAGVFFLRSTCEDVSGSDCELMA